MRSVADFVIRNCLALLGQVRQASDDPLRLEQLQVQAAGLYTAYTLQGRLPAEMAGDLSLAAAQVRAERAEAAAQVWVAAERAIQRLLDSPRAVAHS